jgi:hypothetical protein
MSQWISRFLRENRTYIIPNWNGIGLGLLFFACLFCGALFNHPPVQFFGLILAILYLSGMVQSNSNLTGINIKRIETPLCPADQSPEINITLKNESQESRHQLHISFPDLECGPGAFISTLEAGETRMIQLKIPPLPRGKHSLPQIRISSGFPIGAFYTWRPWKPTSEAIIYPKAISLVPLPSNSEQKAKNGLEFLEHRPAPDDAPPKFIDWKKYAKSSIKLLKVFEDNTKDPIIIRWTDLQSLPLEAKLSQFTYWILELEKYGVPYSVQAPFTKPPLESFLSSKDFYLRAMSSYQENPG